jgi:hypothetical protein
VSTWGQRPRSRPGTNAGRPRFVPGVGELTGRRGGGEIRKRERISCSEDRTRNVYFGSERGEISTWLKLEIGSSDSQPDLSGCAAINARESTEATISCSVPRTRNAASRSPSPSRRLPVVPRPFAKRLAKRRGPGVIWRRACGDRRPRCRRARGGATRFRLGAARSRR